MATGGGDSIIKQKVEKRQLAINRIKTTRADVDFF